jgi:VanZ family protein
MSKIKLWIPAFCIMLAIFVASSTPSIDLPVFGVWDIVVKKGGHMTGYALLGIAFWYGLGFEQKRGWVLAWLLALIYAFSDEFHQLFTPGRHPSMEDIFLFDGIGAAIGLGLLALWQRFFRKKINKSE